MNKQPTQPNNMNNKPTTATAHEILRGGFVLIAKYIPATNHRPTRIKVSRLMEKAPAFSKQTVTVSWSYDGNDNENYDNALKAWIAKHGEHTHSDGVTRSWLDGVTFVRGGFQNGYTYTSIWNR